MAVTAILVAVLGVATIAMSADAATKKKPAVAVVKVAGVPKSTTGAGAFKVVSSVRNMNKKPTKAIVVLRLSKDARPDKGDTKLTSTKTGPLRAKTTKKVTTRVVLPKRLSPRTYYVLACIGASCRAARTTVLRSNTPPPASTDRGKLSGSLTFTRTSLEGWDSVDDQTQINVAMNYKGPFAVSNDLVSTGSTTSYAHKRIKSQTIGEGCTTTTTATTSTGGAPRPLIAKGDRYTDEIWGDIVYNDYTEISVDLNVEYLVTTKVVKGGAVGCPQETTESTRKSWDLMTVRLRQVSRSGSKINYQVKSLTGSTGGSASWKNVTGTLTLILG